MPLSTRPAGGVDARATMVSWLETTTNASARCAFGRDLKSSASCRSKCKKPLLETSAQPKGGASNPRKVPAACELCRKRRFLPHPHRADQLFGELLADDLDQSIVRRTGRSAAMASQQDIFEHQVDQLRRAWCILEVSLLRPERFGLTPGHIDGPQPPAEGKVMDHVADLTRSCGGLAVARVLAEEIQGPV